MKKLQIIRNRKFYTLSSLIIILLLAVTTVVFLSKNTDAPHVESLKADSLSRGISPLYIPKSIPEGYTYKENSLSSSSNVTSYALSSNTPDESIFISLQPIPDNFNFVQFYNQNLNNARQIDSDLGEVFMGSFNQNLTVSVRTETDWILINLPADTTVSDAELVANSLFRSKNPSQ